MIPFPQYLDFETISSCNRVCPTCIRNSWPDRKAVQSWFEPHYMPFENFSAVLDQAIDAGYRGGICTSHFNEPTMDERLPDFVAEARRRDVFKIIFFNTNGDYLNEDLANRFEDAGLDRIIVTLYMDEPIKSKRKVWIESLFHKTECFVITQSKHIASHFSPDYDIPAIIAQNIDHDCKEPAMRAILNHRSQWLLCCEDLIGNFGLGSFPEVSFTDFWFGDAHTKVYNDLLETGGRRKYAHCSLCPKT